MNDHEKHPILVLGVGDAFPEPSEEFFLEYVIKKTGLNEAELWTCRPSYDDPEYFGSGPLHWDRVPTKLEKLWVPRE